MAENSCFQRAIQSTEQSEGKRKAIHEPIDVGTCRTAGGIKLKL